MKISENYTYFFILVLLIPFSSLAQTSCFTADKNRVCVGEEITFENCNEEGWSNSSLIFGDGNQNSGNPSDLTHQYQSPGTYYAYHIGNNDALGRHDTLKPPIKIVVLPLLPPTFLVKLCVGKTITLTINDTIYNEFSVDWENDGVYDQALVRGQSVQKTYPDFGQFTMKVQGKLNACTPQENQETITLFQELENPTIASLSALPGDSLILDLDNLKPYLNYNIEIRKEGGNFVKVLDLKKENGVYPTRYIFSKFAEEIISTSENIYCVKVNVVDECGNNEAVQACTIKLNVAAEYDQNNLSWNTSSEQTFDDFSIIKNSLSLQSNLPGTTKTYNDNQIKCNRNYCYEIIARQGSTYYYSNKTCVVGRSDNSPPPVENINASVNNNSVEIFWNKPTDSTIKEYILSSVTASGPKILFRGLDSTFTDNSIDPNSYASCYSLDYVDSCDNKTQQSISGCTVFLTGEAISQNHNKLQWTNFEGWKEGVKEYKLQVLDQDQSVIRETSAGKDNTFEDQAENEFQVVRYRIMAVPNDNLQVSFSNVFEIKQNFVIALPNAFSPNGDGRNEKFEIVGPYIRAVKMQIYNKWGQLIFQGESWDGIAKSGKASAGTYLYYVEAEDEMGDKITKRGTITLIR